MKQFFQYIIPMSFILISQVSNAVIVDNGPCPQLKSQKDVCVQLHNVGELALLFQVDCLYEDGIRSISPGEIGHFYMTTPSFKKGTQITLKPAVAQAQMDIACSKTQYAADLSTGVSYKMEITNKDIIKFEYGYHLDQHSNAYTLSNCI